MSAPVDARSAGEVRGGARQLTLADLPVGGWGRILAAGVTGSPAQRQRLRDLGFAEGAEISVVRRAPLADPVVYRVCGYDICLRRTQAVSIAVESLSAAAPL